jgi:DNA helicase-2/ATP-dependent DNA helicase PcrA
MEKSEKIFEQEYAKLNKAQKDAVDIINGPVMVVAGPGTGKTQILALRIANILQKTDIKPDGVLCLTFTNSAVEQMTERLVRYIGDTGKKINVLTFHSFGMKVLEEHYKVLGLKQAPRLLQDTETAIFFDHILNNYTWDYLRPRADGARYFKDLRSLISLLKRERISKEKFKSSLEKEIKYLKESEDSVSTRGESKGKLKKEVQKEIEGLERSREIATFLEIYEKEKTEKNVLDYDDILENLVKIVEGSEDVLAQMRERYLYVLIDEHQDSSRVQNEFLKVVWGDVEKPDIFVVGDDRQLIYGFSGASIAYFEGFKKTFSGAKIIQLVDNYRSTQVILDASHALLQSVMSDKKLISQNKEHYPIKLVETGTQAEEIIAAGKDIENIQKTGINPSDCAILVPKNKQVRAALQILHTMDLPVASLEALDFFDQEEAQAFLRVLKIIHNGDVPSLALSFFDKVSEVEPLQAHIFFTGQNMREFSMDKILEKTSPTLFGESEAGKWTLKLAKWKNDAAKMSTEILVETIGQELFANKEEHNLVTGEEIVNTVLGLLTKELEKNPNLRLADFIAYLEKLEFYAEPVPVVTLPKEGIKVLTMHSSKGAEFEYVWIAHMDEHSLTSGKKMAFSLPESIKEKIEERDIDAIKRKLYVAITRAKRFCTLSYAAESEKGSGRELAQIIKELPEEVFEKPARNAFSITDAGGEKAKKDLGKLTKLVAEKYSDRYVSVSLLNNFFECSWKWYFRNLLQLPEAKTESLEFGSAVHSAIDEILKSNKIILPEDKEVAKVVSEWAKRRLAEIATNRENEQSVSLNDPKFPGLKIYGKIDLIEMLRGNKVRVTDFKTGGVRKKSEIEKLDEEGRMSGNLRQLAMYSYLLEESARKLKVQESRLEFLEAKNIKESFYDRIITNAEIELLKKDIADYDKLVKNGKWINRPCNYNSYGKNTECEYCKMAEIYKS